MKKEVLINIHNKNLQRINEVFDCIYNKVFSFTNDVIKNNKLNNQNGGVDDKIPSKKYKCLTDICFFTL